MAITQICVDMDGVLCDFNRALCKLLLRDPDEQFAAWPRGEYSFDKVYGISNAKVWREIDKAGRQFWANLPPLAWCEELWAMCSSKAPSLVLTCPSLRPGSVAGKMDWLHRQFGHRFRDYLIGPVKHACARPGAVLIDDSDENCQTFIEHGGDAIIFPQIWNSKHELAGDPMSYVKTELATLGFVHQQ